MKFDPDELKALQAGTLDINEADVLTMRMLWELQSSVNRSLGQVGRQARERIRRSCVEFNVSTRGTQTSMLAGLKWSQNDLNRILSRRVAALQLNRITVKEAPHEKARARRNHPYRILQNLLSRLWRAAPRTHVDPEMADPRR